jgi:hypothetical protein
MHEACQLHVLGTLCKQAACTAARAHSGSMLTRCCSCMLHAWCEHRAGLAKALQGTARTRYNGSALAGNVSAMLHHARVMTPSAWDPRQQHESVQDLLEWHFEVRQLVGRAWRKQRKCHGGKQASVLNRESRGCVRSSSQGVCQKGV